MSSSVPQGSYQGPLFFLMFIHDIASLLSNFKMYADDQKPYRTVDSLDDTQLLQDYPYRVHQRRCDNCKFTKRRRTLVVSCSIDSPPLTEVTSIRNLGVVLDAILSYCNQIDSILVKLQD